MGIDSAGNESENGPSASDPLQLQQSGLINEKSLNCSGIGLLFLASYCNQISLAQKDIINWGLPCT
jgi:hypothetical protein